MISSDLMPIFEGAYPSCIVTSSVEGMPNIANLTRVWYFDHEHIAIANQLLNKTYKNLMENPLAFMKLVNPNDLSHWEFSVKLSHSEVEGLFFEKVKQDLQTIFWIAGISSPIRLKSVMIFKIVSIRKCMEESLHLAPAPEAYGDILTVLGEKYNWNRISYWVPEEEDQGLKLLASRGVEGAGVKPGVFDVMKRVATLSITDRRIIRLNSVRSQLRYIHSIKTTTNRSENRKDLPVHEESYCYLAFPITEFKELVGVICCEAPSMESSFISNFDDKYLSLLSENIGQMLANIASTTDQERIPLIRQVFERVQLQWKKTNDPFYSVLSPREQQVAIQVAKGHTNVEISKLLFISPRTVTTHLERIYQKLQLASRNALTRYVMENGYYQDDEWK